MARLVSRSLVLAALVALAALAGFAAAEHHMYDTKEQAEAAARTFNCTGAHKMGDKWMVGTNHDDCDLDDHDHDHDDHDHDHDDHDHDHEESDCHTCPREPKDCAELEDFVKPGGCASTCYRTDAGQHEVEDMYMQLKCGTVAEFETMIDEVEDMNHASVAHVALAAAAAAVAAAARV